MSIIIKPIGTIYTEFKVKKGMPIQPKGAKGRKGHIELFDEFVPGLKDLDGFSHVILLYYFHESTGYKLQVKPFLDNSLRGLFSTRAPNRPNGIGLSVVELTSIKGNQIEFINADMLNETPLLDIKPYIDEIDHQQSSKQGWLKDKTSRFQNTLSDNRFADLEK